MVTKYSPILPVFLERYEAIALDNQERLSRFGEITQRCRAVHIPILPLKGTDFLLRAYPHLGQRPMIDIDLLIRSQDLQRFAVLLHHMGFRERYAQESLNASFLEEALTFDSEDNTTSVDVIWDIWYEKDMESLWNRRVERRTRLGDLLLLHPEDALLYHVAYVAAHRGYFSPLFSQDLVAFLNRENVDIDWDRWVACVRALHMSEPVYHALTYAYTHEVTGIPKRVLASLAPRTWAARVLLSYYRRVVAEREIPYGRYFFPFVTTPTWKGRLRFLRQAFFPSRTFLELRLGHPISWAAYLKRSLLRPFWIALRVPYFLAKEWYYAMKK